MGDWIGLGVIILILVGGLLGMARLGTPPKPLTPAEFEERVRQSQGTMSAGVAGMMYALQKLMNPKAAEAVEVMKDLRAGYYDDSEEPDGSDQPGSAEKNSTPSNSEEGNA
ncbi:MAG: hypothetical protein M3430_06150 [Acidobacteriota bacterium]|nr:hypothetical protein [Acidobacteriota bacterium]